jgi:hypothetical protein
MENKDKQGELNKLFKFLGVSQFTPTYVNKRTNESYKDRNKKVTIQSNSPFARKLINFIKPKVRKHKKLYYTLKRNFGLDYYFQRINHKI